jgi:hypothetical protein
METLAEIDSCIARLSGMEAQDAFFHPDFVRLLSLLKFPYLYDGNGTEVPPETRNRMLALVAEKAEAMPRQETDEACSRQIGTCAYAMRALSAVELNELNADYFVRIFLAAAKGGTPPEPKRWLEGAIDFKEGGNITVFHLSEDDGGLFDACADRDAVFQKMLDFRSAELCDSIATRISGLAELRESAVYLFSVALDQSSSGVGLEIDTTMKLAKFARRWADGAIPSPGCRRTIDEGNAHFSGKLEEFERALSALLRQMKAAERQRLARICNMQEFRARWKENRLRQAAIARQDPHFARKLKICSGRC